MAPEEDLLAPLDGAFLFQASSSSIAQDELFEAICRLIQWFVEPGEKRPGILSKVTSLKPAYISATNQLTMSGRPRYHVVQTVSERFG